MLLSGYIVCLLILPVALWVSAVGNIFEYLDDSVPGGQLLYVLSKLVGLLTLSLLTLQISLMSLCSLKLRPPFSTLGVRWTTSNHAILGSLCIFCSVIHVGLFFFAASVRSDHWSWPLLTLRFQSGFYDAMVSVGAIALYLMFLVVLFGWISRSRKKIKSIHQSLVLICTVAVIIHSYAIGSETHLWTFRAYYIVLLVILLSSLLALLRSKTRHQSYA